MTDRKCAMCDKPVSPGRRLYCSTKCANRASWIRKYGLSPQDYRTLLGSGHCAICGRKMRKVNVDHDHKTMLVRGLVCGTCNKRVLTAINKPLQAFNLLRYLLDSPAKMLEGEPRKIGELISARDKKQSRRMRF